jgi:hypothetical protein
MNAAVRVRIHMHALVFVHPAYSSSVIDGYPRPKGDPLRSAHDLKN